MNLLKNVKLYFILKLIIFLIIFIIVLSHICKSNEEKLLIDIVLDKLYNYTNKYTLPDMYTKFIHPSEIFKKQLNVILNEREIFLTKVCDIEYTELLVQNYIAIEPYLKCILSVMPDCWKFNKIITENITMYTQFVAMKLSHKFDNLKKSKEFLKINTEKNNIINNYKKDVEEKHKEIDILKKEKINIKRKVDLILNCDNDMLNEFENIAKKTKV